MYCTSFKKTKSVTFPHRPINKFELFIGKKKSEVMVFIKSFLYSITSLSLSDKKP